LVFTADRGDLAGFIRGWIDRREGRDDARRSKQRSGRGPVGGSGGCSRRHRRRLFSGAGAIARWHPGGCGARGSPAPWGPGAVGLDPLRGRGKDLVGADGHCGQPVGRPQSRRGRDARRYRGGLLRRGQHLQCPGPVRYEHRAVRPVLRPLHRQRQNLVGEDPALSGPVRLRVPLRPYHRPARWHGPDAPLPLAAEAGGTPGNGHPTAIDLCGIRAVDG